MCTVGENGVQEWSLSDVFLASGVRFKNYAPVWSSEKWELKQEVTRRPTDMQEALCQGHHLTS